MFQTLDFFADRAIPIFALLLIGLAIFWLKKAAPMFLLRCILAVGLSQQLAKFVQKTKFFGAEFPSTHFAVALALATCLVVLNRKSWPLSVVFIFFYGALMLWIHRLFPSKYHTPLEMAGAFYAIPVALLCHVLGKKREKAPLVVAN